MATPPLPSTVGVDTLLGRGIVDPHGRRIGELHDIILDLASGRIAYAVIVAHRREGSDRLVVAPWNALFLDSEARYLRINAPADWVQNAPSLQGAYAPARFAHDWALLIHSYFGTTPYWEGPSHRQFA
jgi:sporulation protein YlmC with PRC-barrel domain